MFKFLLPLFLLIPVLVSAQLNDNFNDGNFSANPIWRGEVTDFRVDANQRLQLFAEAESGAKNLYTESNVITNATWQMDVHFGFNPSSSNLAEIYLMADNELLETSSSLFLSIGNTADNIVLVERLNGVENIVLTTPDKFLDVDSVSLSIRVTRNANTFTIDTASVGSNNFAELASGNFSLSITNAQFFGIRCKYTSTRSKLFYFDNFSVLGDVEQNPPSLVSVSCVNSNQLALKFNENLDENSFTFSDFILNSSENPIAINFFQDSLLLTFTPNIPAPTYNTIDVMNVADANGNSINSIRSSFFCGEIEIAEKGDVVINEIMADPTPALLLPEVEFIELFNTSNKAISLQSLAYYNSATLNSFFTDTILLPNTYYTLASQSSAAELKNFGVENVLEAITFSALSNAGDSLTILNAGGDIIDVVRYYSDIYDDSNNDGGISLERINPNENCNNPFNFAFSVGVNQATPSAENSVINANAENELMLLNAQLFSDSSAVISFNQALDLLNFSFQSIDLNGFQSIEIQQVFQNANTYKLRFSDWPSEGSMVFLNFNNLFSCAANSINESIALQTPITSRGNELFITELMVDPSPVINLPDAEYIELYNAANYAVNLSDYSIEKRAVSNTLPPFSMPSNSYLILVSNSDTALFTGLNYLGISAFPGLTNSGDSLALVHNATGNSDVIIYNDEFYSDDEKDYGGYSLENIRPEENCLGKINFLASNSINGGTPGEQNSVFMSNNTTSEPRILESKQLGDVIAFIFDRPVFFGPGYAPTASINITPSTPIFVEGINRDTLLIGLPALLNGTIYSVVLNDIEDCLGNAVNKLEETITPAQTPTLNELIFTEVMADPTPPVQLPETEYFELYNRSSNFISFSNVCLNGENLNSNFILPPQAYVAIGSNNLILEGVDNVIASESISSSFLTNAGKNLVLSDCVTGKLIARLDYNINWHTIKSASDGGFSLELLNNNLDCYNNGVYWASSISKSGGTPGQANSQTKNDFKNAEQGLAYYKNNVLQFNYSAPLSIENIDSDLLPLSDSVKLSTNESTLIFYLNTALSKLPRNYSISVKSCNTETFNTSNIVLTEPQDLLLNESIFINEIMYNPNTGLSEYIELYNASDKTLGLSGSYLNIDEPNFTGKRIDTSGLILPSNSYLLLSDDTLGNGNTYPKQSNLRWLPSFDLPSLGNGSVFIGFQDQFGQFIDSITYSDDLHFNLLSNTKGVSLERIGVGLFTNSADAYTSAAEQFNFGTPGTENSQMLTETMRFEDRLTLSDNYISANGDGFQDAISIIYQSPNPEIITILLYDRAGFVVKRIADNFLTGSNNTFIYKGDSDFNNLPEAGAYILVLRVESSGNNKRDIKRVITISR